MKTRLFLIFLLLLNTACGFQLRGTQITSFSNTTIYIQSSSAPRLAKEVQRQLNNAGVTVTNSANDAVYMITMQKEHFERTVLSTSATTGKVTEYQITFNASLDVFHRDGRNIIKADPIYSSRDFIFDDNTVLGNSSEEALLREEIIVDAANQVLWRLQALLNDQQ